MRPLPLILGLSGPCLTAGERAFFRDADPWAFILFARNIETPHQVRELTGELRDCVGRSCLVFIDQEGGRVQRLRPPHWRNYPAAARLAEIYRQDRRLGRRATWLQYRLISDDLTALGINADCAPVLDIPIKGADPIISDRAFGDTVDMIADLSDVVMSALMSSGVAPVIKHIPGHGRATVDSHLELPRISENLEDLRQSDFAPFKLLRQAPMAMTAHIVYECVDSRTPLTLSQKAVARVVREEIGFNGLLMSDDLDMKALSGSLSARTSRALKSGCDVALQCSGILPDMVKVAAGASAMSDKAFERARLAELCVDDAAEFARAPAEAEFDAILSEFEAAA